MTVFSTNGQNLVASVGNSLEALDREYNIGSDAFRLNGEKCVTFGFGESWYEFVPEYTACEAGGYKAYYKRDMDGLYYEDDLFTKPIGNASALAAWKSVGGAGYLPPLGHHWVYENDTQHKCSHCGETANHTLDEKGNSSECTVAYYDYVAEGQVLTKKMMQMPCVLKDS